MTGALTWARLSYRQQRWELILIALATVVGAALAFWFASTLNGLWTAGSDCIRSGTGPISEAPPPDCQAVLNEWFQTLSTASYMSAAALAAPFGMGVLLGAPLVAREIDGGTAQFAWSMSSSRVSWLLRRMAFIVLFVVALLAVVAVASEILAAAMYPDQDLGESFTLWRQRGWLLVARGVGALLIGALVGAVIGRVLPAVLAAAIVIGLIFVGVALLQDGVLEDEAVAHRINAMDGSAYTYDPADLVVDFGLQIPDGEVMTSQEAYERGLVANVIDEQGRQFASTEDMVAGNVLGYDVQIVIRAERYQEVVAREGAAVIGIGLLALLATAFVVRRRRPV